MSSSHFIFEANQSPSIDLDEHPLQKSDIKDYEFYSTKNDEGSTSTKSNQDDCDEIGCDVAKTNAAINLFDLAASCDKSEQKA